MVPVEFQVIIVLQIFLLANSHVIIRRKDEVSKNSYDLIEEDVEEPLFLTSYIKAGKIEEGKIASRVGPILPDDDFVSYSGFLTVNKEYNSNLFFWYCPNEQNPKNVPVILWLNGGPGCSSLIGLMVENGPYELKPNGELIRREYAWSNEFNNVLYFDQPVGAGFSFTQNEAGYAKTEEDVARDMYNALVQFFQLFPEYSQNDFYLSGESYAGKYVPAIAYEIHKRNSDINVPMKINIKGCLIGNGLIEVEEMNVSADYMYQLGFIDLKTVKEFRDLEASSNTYIRAGAYAGAYDKFMEASDHKYSFPDWAMYNILNGDAAVGSVTELFESDYIRKCIHVGNLSYFECNDDVFNDMNLDMVQSLTPLFVELLNHYKILLYSGQLDMRVGHPLTRNFLENTHFSGAVEYYENDLILWYDECGIQAGHYKVAANLTDLLVLTAGHMVPADQPKRALQMVREFINGEFS